MKIRLADYEEGVISEVSAEYDPKSLDIEFVDLKYSESLRLSGTIEKGPEVLTFRGNLAGKVEHICGRCLASEKEGIQKPFEFFYEIKGRESIETLDDLRETLILDHSLSFVCRRECRGLCPHCGINLNESQCQCSEQASPRTFSQLKQIWNKKEKSRGKS